jgi:hypothetical protein
MATVAQTPVTDTERPVTQEDLRSLAAELRAELDKVRRDAATIRLLEDIWRDTRPGLAGPRFAEATSRTLTLLRGGAS